MFKRRYQDLTIEDLLLKRKALKEEYEAVFERLYDDYYKGIRHFKNDAVCKCERKLNSDDYCLCEELERRKYWKQHLTSMIE